MRRSSLVTCFVGLLLTFVAIAPAAASAADLCVGTHPLCTSNDTYPGTPSGLQQALTATNDGSHAGSDRVFVGPGTYSYGYSNGLSITTNAGLKVIGAGIGSTVINQDNGLSITQLVSMAFADPESSIGNLTIRATSAGTYVSTLLILSRGVLENASLENQSMNPVGMVQILNGPTIRNSSLNGGTAISTAIRTHGQDFKLSNSTITTPHPGSTSEGIRSAGTGHTVNIDHTSFVGMSQVIQHSGGTLNISDSIFDFGSRSLPTANAVVASAAGSTGYVTNLNMSRVTITGTTAERGVEVAAQSADAQAETVNANIEDTLFNITRSFGKAIVCTQSGTNTQVNLSVTNSAFDPARVTTSGNCAAPGPPAVNTATNPPIFVNAAAGDCRPTYDSPVVDAGSDGSSLPAGATDRAGAKRCVDGKGNGVPRVDIGAYEYQRGAPVVSATSSATEAWTGDSLAYAATATDPENEPLTYGWAFDDGATVSGPTTAHAFSTTGLHTAVFTATDVAGSAGSLVITVNVHHPALTITAKPKRLFTRTASAFKAVAKTNRPAIPFTQTDATHFDVRLERITKGVRRSGKCVRGTRGTRCTRYIRVKGTQRLKISPSHKKLTFGGRFNGKRLAAGRYRVTLTPVADASAAPPPQAGTVAGPARRVNITLR